MNPGLAVLALVAGLPVAWSMAGGHMPARGTAAALLLLALGGAILALRRRVALPLPGLIALAAWGWCLVGALLAPAPEPAWIRVAERGSALVLAVGALAWWRGGRTEVLPTLGLVGAGMLILDAVCQVVVPGTGQSLGMWTGIGPDLPCGNPNFTVGAALPLLVAGAAGWATASTGTRLVLAAGGTAAAVLGTGVLSGDATRAVWPALLAAVGLLAVCRLPRAWQGPLTVAAIAGAIALPLVLAAVDWASPAIGASGMYRLALWRAAGEAIAQAPWLGWGTASSLVVLPAQPAYGDAWLAVPSFPEHAHQEFLEALVEGGLPALGLLVAVAVATAWPLWRQRADAVPRALLAGGATALTLALLESHLGQPGPLLCLALLGGAAWAQDSQAADPERASPPLAGWRQVLVAGFAVIAVGLLGRKLVREAMAGDLLDGAGPPPVVDVLHRRALERAREAKDWREAARLSSDITRRLGPLIDGWHTQAEAAARLGDVEAAVVLSLRQSARLPLLPEHLDLLDRLEKRARERQWPSAAALTAARERALALARRVVERHRSTDQPEIIAWLARWVATADAPAKSPER